MAKNIEPKLKKIGEYLTLEKKATFVIPDYQRAYSWGISNCDMLWQDINDFVDSGSDDCYFFGTIIINCKNDDREYDLIDGQQRTTTFLLLLKALLIRINDAIINTNNDQDSKQLSRGLKEHRRTLMKILYKADVEDIQDEPDKESDAEIYSNAPILKNFSINEQYKDELQNILKSIDFDSAEKNVTKIKYKQKDNRYTNFFRNFKFFYDKAKSLSDSQVNSITRKIIDHCEVIEIKSWQVEQAITMFNSLNSAGLPLNDADIISARMMARAGEIDKVKEFKTLWKELNECISEADNSNGVDINAILMQYMYYIRTQKKETISSNGATDVAVPGVRRYYIDINKDLIKDPILTCSNFLRLAKIWKKISNFPQVKILFKFNDNSKLFLSSYLYRFEEENISEDRIKVVLDCLIRLFALLEIDDRGYSSKNFKTFLFKEEVDLIDKSILEDKIKNDFDNHICTNWDKSKIKEKLVEYDGYALVYLNEYLFARNVNIEFNLGDKYDIEHIMPYSGKNLSQIRSDANISDQDEFNAVVNKLGNKILLEGKINRAIGNEWFRTKISTKLEEKTGYVDSTYPIAKALVKKYESVNNKPYWTKDDIIDATEKAAERILKYIYGE